jgi:hypothetical protein
MVQLSATRCNCSTILWVSLVSFATITLCVASQWVLLLFISLSTQSGNFWIHPPTVAVCCLLWMWQHFIVTVVHFIFLHSKSVVCKIMLCISLPDEYWSQHPELHDIPIYYASSLAKKCMAVYQTYVNAMNDKIRRQIAINNPFVFRHISNLKVT